MCVGSHHRNLLSPESLGRTASQTAWNASHSHPVPQSSGPTQVLGLGPSSPAVDPMTADGSAVRGRAKASSVFLLRVSWCFPRVPAPGISRRLVQDGEHLVFVHPPWAGVTWYLCDGMQLFDRLRGWCFLMCLWSSLLIEFSPPPWSGGSAWGAAHLTPVRPFPLHQASSLSGSWRAL